jgi:signal transduction histidine kinase
VGGFVNESRDRSYRWAFYVAAGLLYAGSVLRAPISIEDGQTLLVALALLLVWLVLFLLETFFSGRLSGWFPAYLAVQSLIVTGLLFLPGSYDFFAVLFGILSMQAMDRYGMRLGPACIAIFVPLIAVPLAGGWEPAEVAAFGLIYTALNVLLGVFALAARRASEARAANEALSRNLHAANQELREYSTRLESLAVARERNRVARDLHDSVTQTIFSMNLTTQSAILLKDQPDRVRIQLDRLADLTQTALSEMHTLIVELAPRAAGEGGVAEAIRRDIERRARDGLEVSFAVDEPPVGGSAVLGAPEEQALLRIAQEALNNVAKHSGSARATIRLRLWEPLRLEIEDRGAGFDARETREGHGIGLASMRERAAEIGWRLEIQSEPGKGTMVVVERLPPEESKA